MSDWSAAMSLTAAEMRNNTTEEVMQIAMKELGMRQSVINARLKGKPARAHKVILITMITNARYQATKRANLIRNRRRAVEKLLKN